MDLEKLKTEVKEIAEIANSVPEAFKEKCFEILLNGILNTYSKTNKKDDKENLDQKDQTEVVETKNNTLQMPSVIKAFMRRNDISIDQINDIIMIDEGEFHFIKEPSHQEIARGQNEWALLNALKNGIQSNSLAADPEQVRSITQDKGYYDKSNFSGNFKKPKYSVYYKGTLEGQGSAQTLTAEGEKALASVIKELAK